MTEILQEEVILPFEEEFTPDEKTFISKFLPTMAIMHQVRSMMPGLGTAAENDRNSVCSYAQEVMNRPVEVISTCYDRAQKVLEDLGIEGVIFDRFRSEPNKD